MKRIFIRILMPLLLLCTSVYAQTTLKVGDKAPAFSAQNQNGKTVSLKDYIGKKVILYFYPKDNTPGCTKEACNLRDYKDTLATNGYVILGVSTDDAVSHQNFIKQYNLPFDLLVDSDAAINKAYGVWVQKERDGKVFYGTARTTFIIDEHGVITKIINDVKVDAHASQILTK
jgi:peroxiredoxin Q/BCP